MLTEGRLGSTLTMMMASVFPLPLPVSLPTSRIFTVSWGCWNNGTGVGMAVGCGGSALGSGEPTGIEVGSTPGPPGVAVGIGVWVGGRVSVGVGGKVGTAVAVAAMVWLAVGAAVVVGLAVAGGFCVLVADAVGKAEMILVAAGVCVLVGGAEDKAATVLVAGWSDGRASAQPASAETSTRTTPTAAGHTLCGDFIGPWYPVASLVRTLR
jgi:hypothetical protein